MTDPKLHATPREGSMKMKVIVHILHYGQPLCGFSSDVPAKWPLGHRWVPVTDKNRATCPFCKTKSTEKRKT